MKIRIAIKRRQMASALLIALVICAILSISVVGYLTLTEQQNLLNSRSQAWNLAMSTAEAGVEEGLQQLNSNYDTLSNDGWTFDGTLYGKSRYLADGNYYTVTINKTAAEIISRAYFYPPRFAKNGSSTFLATQGVNLRQVPVSRAVRVRASKGSLITKAMVAKHNIDMNGQNVLVNSFDSESLTYSANGKYDASKAKDNGDVASNDIIISSVSVGNANIYGHVSTGGGGTVALGSHGAIGPRSWQSLGNEGIFPGWVTADSNFTFPDTSLPYSSGLNPGPGDVVSTSFTYGTNSVSSTNFPSPYPVGGVTTNAGANITTTTRPNPVPAGTVTNTTWTTTDGYPAAGTYIGSVQTNYNGNSSNIRNYSYNRISSYTYPGSFTYNYSALTTNTVSTTNHYDHVLLSGDYYLSSDLTGTTYVSGEARLVLPTGLKMSGNDTLTIGPSGKLSMYSGGTSCKIAGNGIVNQSGFAVKMQLFCTPSVTDFSLDGNGEFTGVLIAPNADLKLNGGGHSDNDFIGAMVVNTVKMNGHYSFHYDEALGRLPANGRLLITSWDEIDPN